MTIVSPANRMEQDWWHDMKPFRCECGHLNLRHTERVGQGPFRCDDCDCKAFTWDGSEATS